MPSRPPEEQIAVARRLHARGFEPVPHLAARNFASAVALDDYLARMAEEAGVRRLLVIGGDRDTPAGGFHHAIEVIESGLPQSRGIREIGIAGYPEGHPRVAAAEIDRLLAAKIEAAAATGLAVHIVTQFAFSPAPILAYVARLRERGIEQPVRIGIAGPASVATLHALSRRSAASPPRRARSPATPASPSTCSARARPTRSCARSPARSSATSRRISSPSAASARPRAGPPRSAAGRIALDRAGGFRVEPP